MGPHVDGFAGSLIKQGYSRRTVRPKVWLIGELSRWLDARGIALRQLDEQLVATFLRDTLKARRPRDGDKVTLEAVLRHLREVGAVRTPAAQDDTRDLFPIESQYEHYLIYERGLSPPSVRYHIFHTHRFVSECFGSKPIRFTLLRQHHITQHILRHAPTYKQRSAHTWLSTLRVFLRYLYLCGETNTDLSEGVLRTASWNLSVLPKYIEAPQVERLLRVVDRSTRMGRRDYAILLLLARLGLRGGEVVHMELEDLHWDTGELTVRGKNSRWSRMPLPVDVGEALVAYLRRGRPRCSTRRVFIRMLAPHTGFRTTTAVSSLVADYLDRAGIHVARKGAHVLRHSLATRMLREGGSLEEISRVLRHLHRSSTEIYAKVDLRSLRALAQPWPGVAS